MSAKMSWKIKLQTDEELPNESCRIVSENSWGRQSAVDKRCSGGQSKSAGEHTHRVTEPCSNARTCRDWHVIYSRQIIAPGVAPSPAAVVWCAARQTLSAAIFKRLLYRCHGHHESKETRVICHDKHPQVTKYYMSQCGPNKLHIFQYTISIQPFNMKFKKNNSSQRSRE